MKYNRIGNPSKIRTMPPRERVLSKRNTPLSPHEISLFMEPIRKVLDRLSQNNFSPAQAIPEIINAEKQAIMKVGLEIDLAMKKQTRSKTIDLLANDEQAQTDYVDLLLTLTRMQCKTGELAEAEETIGSILRAETQKGNWHALMEATNVFFKLDKLAQAQEYLEKAKSVMPNYHFTVTEEEKWEMYVFDAYFFFRNNGHLSGEKIEELFKPLVKIPAQANCSEGIPTSTEKIPGLIAVCLQNLAETETKEEEVISVLQKLNNEVFIRFYLHYRINYFLRRYDFKKVQELLKNNNLSHSFKKYFEQEIKEWKIIQQLNETFDFIEKIMAGEVKLDEISAIKLKQKYSKLIEEPNEKVAEIKDDLRAEMKKLIENQIKQSNNLRGVVFLISQLNDPELELVEVFQQLITENSVKELFVKEIKESWLKDAQIHDFFFVHLREIEEIRKIFREQTGIPWAEPVAMSSLFYESQAYTTTNFNRRAKFLTQALLKDPRNLVAKFELAKTYVLLGKHSEAEKIFNQLLGIADHPLLKFLIYGAKIAQCAFLIKSPKLRSQAAQEAETYFADAEKLYSSLLNTEKDASEEWRRILKNMAHINSVSHNFEQAEKYYQLFLKVEPRDEIAPIEVGLNLMKQGKFIKAAHYLSDILNKRKSFEPHILQLLAKISIQMYDLENAERFITTTIKYEPKHLDCLLTQAQICVFSKRFSQAEEIIKKVEKLLTEHQQNSQEKFEESSLHRLNGIILFLKAEILAKRGNNNKALELYRRAVSLLSQDFDSEYYEIEARSRMIEFLSMLGTEELKASGKSRFMGEALNEAKEFLLRYPFSAQAHESIIAPQTSFGKDREAIAHLRFLAETAETISVENLANVIILYWNEGKKDETAKEAEEILSILSAKYLEEFKTYFKKALALAREYNPNLKLEDEEKWLSAE